MMNEKSEAKREAQVRGMENLLNCYFREIASPADEASFERMGDGSQCLIIRLPATKSEIRAECARQGVSSSHGLGPGFWFRKEAGEWVSCEGSDFLYARLADELAFKFGDETHPELVSLISNSELTQRRLLESAPNLSVPTTYLESEQRVLYGHPFHPSPKSRIGFSEAELRDFSPENAHPIQLEYFAASPELVIEGSIDPESATQVIQRHVKDRLQVPAGFKLIPLHPWQAAFALEQDEVKAEIARGTLIHLGPAPGAEPVFATASVRTLYSEKEDFFYKVSLNVRITNCIRRNALHELRSALHIAELTEPLLPDLSRRFPGFSFLREPAYATLAVWPEVFGVMLREGFSGERGSERGSDRHMIAAALFGNRELGGGWCQSILRDLSQPSQVPIDEVAEAWFEAYVERILHPVLYLFFEYGIMFEAHLQNVVVGLSGGFPDRMILRDFDNAKLLKCEHPDPEVREEVVYSEDKAWRQLVYCLFVNHLFEAANLLWPSGVETHFRVLRRQLVKYQTVHGTSRSAARIRELLEAPVLPAKTNLITRARKMRDRDSGHVGVPNPVSVCAAELDRQPEALVCAQF